MSSEVLLPVSVATPSNKQRVFIRYYTGFLIDLVVLNLASTPAVWRTTARGWGWGGALAQAASPLAAKAKKQARVPTAARSGDIPVHRPGAAAGCVSPQDRSQRTEMTPPGEIVTVTAPSRSVRSTRTPAAA